MNNIKYLKFLVLTALFSLFATASMISQCSITDLVITNSECDDTDNYSIVLDFEYEGVGMNGFQVLGNGTNYGTFQYDNLPITIEGLIGNCELELEFIVRDVIDPTCAAFIEYGPVCCEDVCAISIIDLEATECENNISFGLELNLEYIFVGNEGFSVDINGIEYGEFSYEDLPLTIDDIVDGLEGLNTISVCDLDFAECCTSQTFLNPCQCGITNITSEILDCNEMDSTYFVSVNFDHVATTDSFQMGYSNGGNNIFLGTFSYANLPVIAGPIQISDNDQEILIVDEQDFFCFSSAYLGVVDDCMIECQLYNLFAEPIQCEEGEYFMEIEFEGEDLEGSNFEVVIDGVNYGTYQYGENLYTVGPIPSNCDAAPTVVINDSNNEFCSDFFNLSEPVCCPADCNFTSFTATPVCGVDILTINGQFENDGGMLSAFYFIQFQGTSYGPFLYGDFTFELEVPLLPNGEYVISINDSIDPECTISTTFIAQCDEEPCLIFDVFAEASECDGTSFFVDVEFEFAGEASDSFSITGNGMNYGSFAYGAQFYTVGPLNGDCTTLYEFVITDLEDENCNSSYAFDEPICCEEECAISGLEITDFDCNLDETISLITINFVHENTPSDSFNVQIGGIFSFVFAYNDLPVTIETTLPLFFVLEVMDTENMECSQIDEFEFECMDEDCMIDAITTDFIECSDDKDFFFVSLNFDSESTSDSFLLITADTLYGTYNYAELPLDLGPLPINTSIDFIINDQESGDECTNDFNVFLEQCETSLNELTFENLSITQHAGQVIIENNEADQLLIQFMSYSGVVIQTFELEANSSKSINTANLASGLYLLNISNKRGQKTEKVVVF